MDIRRRASNWLLTSSERAAADSQWLSRYLVCTYLTSVQYYPVSQAPAAGRRGSLRDSRHGGPPKFRFLSHFSLRRARKRFALLKQGDPLLTQINPTLPTFIPTRSGAGRTRHREYILIPAGSVGICQTACDSQTAPVCHP